MKKITPKHITNITYQDFDDCYYYITYPGVKPYLYGINVYGDIITLAHKKPKKRKLDHTKNGYLMIKLRGIEKDIKVPISRLIAWEFVGQPENYMELEANHADGIIINNFYQNIEWTTTAENQMHKAIYGLSASSEKHGWNSHPEKVVRYVIRKIDKGLKAPEIARMTIKKFPKFYANNKHDYDRLRGLVSKINNKTSWYRLKDKMEGSTTIESIIYEKHIGEEVSRVGLYPIAIRYGGQLIFNNKKGKLMI